MKISWLAIRFGRLTLDSMEERLTWICRRWKEAWVRKIVCRQVITYTVPCDEPLLRSRLQYSCRYYGVNGESVLKALQCSTYLLWGLRITPQVGMIAPGKKWNPICLECRTMSCGMSSTYLVEDRAKFLHFWNLALSSNQTMWRTCKEFNMRSGMC